MPTDAIHSQGLIFVLFNSLLRNIKKLDRLGERAVILDYIRENDTKLAEKIAVLNAFDRG